MDVSINKSQPNPKCIFVIGPTASGKSAWALEQAKRTGGVIVNIDSVQFYKGLIVGAAAPSESEKKIVPHYLYSYVEAPNEMTAGEYLREFYQLVEKEKISGPIFIVGGTGFYIQALEKGMFDVPTVPASLRLQIEDELQTHGAQALHDELLKYDPHNKIHVNDHFRLVRALEIIRFTGKTTTQLQAEHEKNKNSLPFDYIKVGFDFDKANYIPRVKARTEKMVNEGIIEEAEHFLQQGYESWAPLNSVGYRETVEFLKEGKTRDWLTDFIQQSTMQLIKKQKTWFKRDDSVLWSNHDKQSLDLLRQKLDQFLS